MTGGHLRVVRPHGYRVVPKWSPKEQGKRPLLGVWADVGAAAGDGEDQALVAEDLDRAQCGIRPTPCSCWSCLTDGNGPFRHSLLAIGPLPQPGAGEFPHRGKQAEHAYGEQSNRQDGYLKQRVRAWVVRPDSEIPEEPDPREHHQQAYRTERDLVSRCHEADVAAGHVDPL